jgi:hypothetical protein
LLCFVRFSLLFSYPVPTDTVREETQKAEGKNPILSPIWPFHQGEFSNFETTEIFSPSLNDSSVVSLRIFVF